MSRLSRCALVSAMLLVGSTVGAVAQQNAPLAPEANAPALELTQAQKETIYQSVSKPAQKNNAAPPGFRPAVGMHVPETIELASVPGTLARIVPELEGFEVAMVERQVVIVDPKSKTIVAVVAQP